MFLSTMHLPNAADPWKEPARRWLRCQYLLAHGQPPFPTRDDALTWQAWRYCYELERCPDTTDHEQLAQEFPAVAEAYRFHTTAPLLRRAELEARLLADESDDTIGSKLGLSPPGVGAYAALYFDVRPYLQADTYIVNVVLGNKVQHGLTPDDHELLLKTFGYAYGVHGVDEFLDYLREPPDVPAALDQLALAELKKLAAKLRTRLLILSLCVPVSAASLETWRWLQLRFLASRQQQEGIDNEATLLGSIQATLNTLTSVSKGEIRIPSLPETVAA
ncbi:MAG: hypothetical protein ACYC6M_15735 [Terriglobales bacterium]